MQHEDLDVPVDRCMPDTNRQKVPKTASYNYFCFCKAKNWRLLPWGSRCSKAGRRWKVSCPFFLACFMDSAIVPINASTLCFEEHRLFLMAWFALGKGSFSFFIYLHDIFDRYRTAPLHNWSVHRFFSLSLSPYFFFLFLLTIPTQKLVMDFFTARASQISLWTWCQPRRSGQCLCSIRADRNLVRLRGPLSFRLAAGFMGSKRDCIGEGLSLNRWAFCRIRTG